MSKRKGDPGKKSSSRDKVNKERRVRPPKSKESFGRKKKGDETMSTGPKRKTKSD